MGLRWALCRCLPGCCVPKCACVAAVCWGRGWSGARVTRGLCPVGRWCGGVGGTPAPGVGLPVHVTGWPTSGASLLLRVATSGGRFAGVLACLLFGCAVPPLGISALGGPQRLGPPLAAVLPSATGVPPLPPWRPPWATDGAAASSLIGVATRVWQSGRGTGLGWPPICLPVPARCHSPWLLRAVLPVPRPRDAGPLLGARGPVRLSAGRWRAPGPGPGPGWGPADCQMVLPWAVLPVRLLGRGVDGVRVRPVPGPADGTLGLTCRVPLEPGDWGSRWGCGRGGARCPGVARAGRW